MSRKSDPSCSLWNNWIFQLGFHETTGGEHDLVLHLFRYYLITGSQLSYQSPDDFVKPRKGLGIGLIALYYIFLFPVLAYYLRLMQIIIVEPDYVSKEREWDNLKEDVAHR
jgi:hypothetical protein